MKKVLIILFLFCFLINNKSFGEARKITLKECIKIALDNHPDILVSIEDRKLSLAKYKLAKAPANLQIKGEIKTTEFTRKDSSVNSEFTVPGVGTDIGLFAGVTASYQIFDLTTRRRIKSARINMDLAKFNAMQKKDEITLNVKKVFYNYLIARKNMGLREKLLKKHTEKLNLAKRLFNSGQRPILDVSKARVGFAEASLEFEKAKNHEKLMKIELFSSMGIKENGIEIDPQDVNTIPAVKFSIVELNKLAQLYYPKLSIIKLQKKISKIKISIEKAERWPKMEIQFGLGFRNDGLSGFDNFEENFESTNWEIAASGFFRIAFPIYSGGAVSAKIDAAIHEYNKIVYQEREVLLNLQKQIRIDFRKLEELTKQQKMSKLVIENAKKHLLLARKSYQNGLGSLLELQDAELSVINAELGFLEAKYNYLLTIAKLANTVGLGEDFICKK